MSARPPAQVDLDELIARVRPHLADAKTAEQLVDALLELAERRRADAGSRGAKFERLATIRRADEILAARGLSKPERVKALQERFRLSRTDAYRKTASQHFGTSGR